MTTEQVNPEPTDVATELYKAVIGPNSQDYYLLRFSAFDAHSKRRVTWHWPAFLSTLNWLVYRRMWGWALGYAAVSTAVALAIFGVGKLFFIYSDSTTKVLAALFLFATFVLPALFANAIYYRFCKTKISNAVAASSDLQQAYERLAKEASSNRRLIGLALINVGLLGLIAVVASFLPNLSQPGKKLPLTTKTEQARTAAASKAKPAGLPPVARPAATPASAPAAAASAAAAVPAAPTSAPTVPSTPVTSTPVTSTPTSSVQAPSAATSKPSPPDKPQKPAAAEVAAKSAQPAKPAIVPETKTAAAAKPEAPGKPQQPAAAEATVKPEPPAKPAKPEVAADKKVDASRASDAAPSKANKPDRRYFIQVGAFANATNVANARAKVEETGLATFTQPIETPGGRLIRVRVGPFDRKAEANKAAAQIKAAGLAALLLRL